MFENVSSPPLLLRNIVTFNNQLLIYGGSGKHPRSKAEDIHQSTWLIVCFTKRSSIVRSSELRVLQAPIHFEHESYYFIIIFLNYSITYLQSSRLRLPSNTNITNCNPTHELCTWNNMPAMFIMSILTTFFSFSRSYIAPKRQPVPGISDYYLRCLLRFC